jgi:hypothetical protein
MARFDASGFNDDLAKDDKAAHDKVMATYTGALEELSGLSEAQLQQFSASTEDLSELMSELNTAIEKNHSQAQLISNIKLLGGGALRLAKQVKGLI